MAAVWKTTLRLELTILWRHTIKVSIMMQRNTQALRLLQQVLHYLKAALWAEIFYCQQYNIDKKN